MPHNLPHSPTGTTGLQRNFAIEIRKVFRRGLNDIYGYLDSKEQQQTLSESLILKSALDKASIAYIYSILEKIKLNLSPVVTTYIATTWWRGNKVTAQATGLGEYIHFDRRVIKTLQDKSYFYLDKYVNGQQKDLLETLQIGISQGDTPKTIANEIKENFRMTSWKSEQIARTEVVRTHNQSTLMAIRQGGITKEVKWLTSRRENICKVCKPLHGRIFNIDDPNMPIAPKHPNCNCSVVPHVKIPE